MVKLKKYYYSYIVTSVLIKRAKMYLSDELNFKYLFIIMFIFRLGAVWCRTTRV